MKSFVGRRVQVTFSDKEVDRHVAAGGWPIWVNVRAAEGPMLLLDRFGACTWVNVAAISMLVDCGEAEPLPQQPKAPRWLKLKPSRLTTAGWRA